MDSAYYRDREYIGSQGLTPKDETGHWIMGEHERQGRHEAPKPNLVIDYNAALRVIGEELKIWADRTNQSAPLFKTRAQIARRVVDAALRQP